MNSPMNYSDIPLLNHRPHCYRLKQGYIIHYEHTYNALNVVRVTVRVWVNPNLALNYDYTAL